MPTVNVSPNAKQRFFDANGVPLAGGKLFTYQAGTTTKQNTYTDSTGATPNTNPIILDSGGYCNLWLDQSLTYKLTLSPSTDTDPPTNPIWTVDQLNRTPSPLTNALAASSGSSLVGTISPATGAVPRTVAQELNNIVYADGLGFLPSATAADNMAALGKIATYINLLGGAILVIPPGTYNVQIGVGNVAMALSNLLGLTILSAGAVINDTTTYTGTQSATLLQLTACRNNKIALKVTTQLAVTTSSILACGLIVVEELNGCIGNEIDLDITGGLIGLQPTKLYTDPLSYKSRVFTGQIKATGCKYPFAAQFSGDEAQLIIDADTCGRNSFSYGVRNQKLTIRSKNQQMTTIIEAYNGYGCEDIELHYYDRESTNCLPAAPCIAIMWGDSTAAAHRNINIHCDTLNPPAAPFAATIGFYKFSDGGGLTPDTTGRGHVLDGFHVSGIMDATGAVAHNHIEWVSGVLSTTGTPDVIRNFSLDNLTLYGQTAISLDIQPLADIAKITNVNTPHGIYLANGSGGSVKFSGVTAGNLSGSVADTSVQTYLECNITDGTLQSEINKTFRNTTIAGTNYDDFLGRGTWRASKELSGNLTGANNIFFTKLPAGLGASFRLKYSLVYDQSDSNPATRSETFGEKYFSATMDSNGNWTIQVAVADAITQKSLNTASVVTVSFVNGTAAGAYIAIACSNYNNANSRGGFSIEMIPMEAGKFIGTHIAAA